MPDVEIRMTVNGRKLTRRVAPYLRLIDFVRDELHLTGSKEGCGAGECGTCSVFVNGVLHKSCLLPVLKAQDAEVTTVEGLARNGELSVLQKAFHKSGASQCGYCIPGMVMAATATLRRNPNAGREEIKEGLGGNICRCTGYQKILDAVELARDVTNGTIPASMLEEAEHGGKFIGASVRRLDAPGKVSGALRYAADMTMPNMLHMQVLRSPVASARIAELDVSQARSMPGVELVLTCDDVPGTDNFGVFYADQPIMARGVVRYAGEGIAAVVAEDPMIAREAIRNIRLRLEPLPAVFDPEQALLPDAPQLFKEYPGNLCKHTKIRKGDVDRAFALADMLVEQTYSTQRLEHAYLEPEAGLAYMEADGTVTVLSPDQNITHHRHMLARILGRPINKVRVIMSPVGGGFGGKEDMLYQGMLALAAIRTGRPVRYVFTREESFLASAKREPARMHVRTGLSRDGHILAHQVDLIADGGAYAMSSPGVMNKAAILAAGPYAIENVRVDAIAVYTNNTPSGAFRSFGAYESEFATETHLDLCAERLGMDPIELRRRNAMRDGAVTHTQQTLGSVSLLQTLDAAAGAAGWEPGVPHRQRQGAERSDLGGPGTRKPCTLGARLPEIARGANDAGASAAPAAKARTYMKKRGRGVASCWYGIARTAAMDRAAAWVELDDGGTLKVTTGVTEIGEGILTVLCQIAADEMGVRPDDVTLGDNDTARAPEAAHAGATRQTYMIGNAVASACREARGKFYREMARHWEVSEGDLEARDGEVGVKGTDLRMSMAEAVELLKSTYGVVIVGSANFTTRHTPLDPVDGHGTPWQSYVFGTQIAEVEVDTHTGEVQVLGIWAAHDVGRAVNPQGVQAQIEGGVVMGLGHALMEDFVMENGHTSTPGFAKYILPTSLDVPHITSIIVEDVDPMTPLGVKGIGEPAMVPTAPAIINAIYDAIGVRITSLPATPEKVLEALLRQRERAAAD